MTRHSTWTRDEQTTARNLFERAVPVEEIADTINAIYRQGRTSICVRRRMSYIGAHYGSALEPDEIDAATAQKQRAGRNGQIGRMFYLDSLHAFDRPQPWNPACDPKPDFLCAQRRARSGKRAPQPPQKVSQ